MSRVTRKLAAAGSALVMVLSAITVLTVSSAGAADPISYTFRFENGVTLSGTATDKTHFLAGAGGTSVDNPTGMEVHLSCSDKFEGGWGQKDGPEQGVDTAWRIDSYFIQKGNKTCGTPTPPPPPPEPAIDIEKFVNGHDADDPTGPEIQIGETATFSYEVTNTGDVDVRNVAVVDSELGPIDCPHSELGVGESMSCAEETEVVTESGQFTMKATVTGIADVLTVGLPNPLPAKAKHAARFTFVNGTTVTRITDKKDEFFPEVGGTSVDNPTGTKIHLSCSDRFVGGWGQKDGPTQGVDTAWQIASYSIGKIKKGQFELKCGDPFVIPEEVEVMDMDPVHFIVPEPSDPKINIEKYINGQDADTPPGPTLPAGSNALFMYIVDNPGDVTVTDIQVTDNVVGPITCPRTELEPGEWMLCSPTTMEVEPGDGFMEACVVGIGADQPVDDCDPVYFNVPGDPKIDIEKFVNGHDADTPPGPTLDVGSIATFTYTVTNTGDVDLEDVTAVDNVVGALTCPRSELGVGESMDCQSTTMEVESGQQFMKACVDGIGVGTGQQVDDCDPVHYYGEDKKHDDPVTIGDDVSYKGGAPAPDVEIDLFEADPNGNRTRYIRSTRSDQNGNYTFGDLPAGCYTVVFIAPAGSEFTNGGQYLQRSTCLDPGGVDNTLDAVLRSDKY